MHQQHQSVNTPSGPSGHTVQVSVGGMNQVIGINKLDTFDTILLRYTPIPSLVSLSVYASMSVQRVYTALSRPD